MKKIKTITKYSNLNDFSVFFDNDWNIKENIVFKIYWFISKRYKEETDKVLITTTNLLLKNKSPEFNISINNFYLISFDNNKNTIDWKFSVIEILEK
jgi:hypothetical protein